MRLAILVAILLVRVAHAEPPTFAIDLRAVDGTTPINVLLQP